MNNVHTPEHGIENTEQRDPLSDGVEATISGNAKMAERLNQPATPGARALRQQYSSKFGHDAERFGNVQNQQFLKINGRTQTLDTSALEDAKAAKQTAEIQGRLNKEAEDMMQEAEAIASTNSADIPEDNPEAAKVSELDQDYAAEVTTASSEISDINGGVAEEMDAALAQAG